VVHGVDDARSLDARRELVRQNLCKLGHERTLNPVFHARRQDRRQSCRLGDPGELESILLDEVDVVGMRPGHRADLVVNQQHRGAGGTAARPNCIAGDAARGPLPKRMEVLGDFLIEKLAAPVGPYARSRRTSSRW
jgi:hypothetical protein